MMADIAGHDPKDPTSSTVPVPDFYKPPSKRLQGLRVGVPQNFYFEKVDAEVSRRPFTAQLTTCAAWAQ